MMKKNKLSKVSLLVVTLCSLLMTSCIKDEPLNMECDILSAWVEGDEYVPHFYQTAQMRLENIASNEKEIVFSVRSLISLSKQIPVNFTLTPGATISPANGSVQDFTNGPVTYTVTSEDGAWKREYKVVFQEASLPSDKFSFENVEIVEASSCSYHGFYEIDQNGTRHNIWATGNPGAAIIAAYKAQPETFPTYSYENGYVGRCVCMNTQTTGQLGEMMKKPIAAGNLFLGKFNVNSVLLQPLKATEFGIPMDREPVRVTGYYKYQPGPEFTNAKKEIVPGRVDEASIYAVFFRNTDESGKSVVLYGDDVMTSPLILKIAQVESLPATNEWTRFEMFFKGSDADEAILASQGYSLTLVFSSSKNGDNFEGSVGSTLYIDEVEVLFDNDEE